MVTRKSALAAKRSRNVSEEDLFDDDSYYGGRKYGRTSRTSTGKTSGKTSAGKRDNNAVDSDEDEAWDQHYENGSTTTTYIDETDRDTSFLERTKEGINALREDARSTVSKQTWKPEQLYAEEDNLPTPSRRYNTDLANAVKILSQNLVERSEEARLLVLGMVANEHVLLLGRPGTGASSSSNHYYCTCVNPCNFFSGM